MEMEAVVVFGRSLRTFSGMSKRAGGGGNATVTRGLCVGYFREMIEGIKSYKPIVKASKSDKWL